MNTPHVQSALHAARGSHAALLHELGLVLYVGATLIFVLVLSLALWSVFSKSRPVRWQRWIIGGGLAFPVATLTALLIYSLSIGKALDIHPDDEHALRIHVTAHQWWWEVRYEAGGTEVASANELHIPSGRRVHLSLSTRDVIHSFWVPPLAGKVDMIPGRTNHLSLRADEPGLFRGQCAEYCGAQHALMAFYVVVDSPEEFDRWLIEQRRPAQRLAADTSPRGYELFQRGGCARCHAIRGMGAAGTLGPDLTHVGSRRSLGAGLLRNHVGTMAGWIGGAQDLKPGIRMPSTNVYTGEELRELSLWLGSLE
jgi:cytochrome c oxidase subunit 2